MQTVQFPTKDESNFYQTLRSRVDGYFKENNISKFGNGKMISKTVFMLLLYFVPYGLIISGLFTSSWALLVISLIMGTGLAGIGLSIMHDANHGSYSKSRKSNKFIGYILNVVGGNSLNWRIQHNVLHHSFTNIEGHDEDIDPAGILRFSPHAKLRKIHKFQHFYAWIFYGLMSFTWIVNKDFTQLYRFKKKGLIEGFQTTFAKEFTILIITKILYWGYMFVTPYLLLNQYHGIETAWWQVALGIFGMHYVAGIILALVFQPAHVMEDCTYPLPTENGEMKEIWAIHQLRTTCNFAKGNLPLSWYVGGLNFQIEHHLFPDVCHVHYRKISNIVKKTAKEFNLPYYQKKTFTGAIISHFIFLKKLGNPKSEHKIA
ncbi:MAG: acyl-CoA desaturase [Crocinitomicaceae bacterium]|jgi:linoleoyl-CoA desaturase|nr:acyl-CoA desaturase [Crocinitomicaceae bacterium]MBT5402328.1 acyl-CoA desaturase [Crocinitomicaceae bacterium]MBT6030018.1 acyl-CoA desaturase [Crocinitomicaceae bacterium]